MKSLELHYSLKNLHIYNRSRTIILCYFTTKDGRRHQMHLNQPMTIGNSIAHCAILNPNNSKQKLVHDVLINMFKPQLLTKGDNSFKILHRYVSLLNFYSQCTLKELCTPLSAHSHFD